MRHKHIAVFIASAAMAVFMTGCTTTGGAFGGGAIGALAGQAIGGDTESTLIGAGVGALSGALVADHVNQERSRSYHEGYSAGYYDSRPVDTRSRYYHPRREIHYVRPHPVVVVPPPPPPPPGAVIIYP